METILVTGGAGYIGSHLAYALLERGFRVVVYDDLSTGVRDNVPEGAQFVIGDVGDAVLLDSVMRQGVDAVVHFAAKASVPESMERPLEYYRTNTAGTLSLTEACVRNDVRRFVLSSTCSVYGEPEVSPITEQTPTQPVNPYGASKRMAEQILLDAARTSPLRAFALRYFNVAGADPEGRTGESTTTTHRLVKVACQAALGRRPGVYIFGTDYATPDGTCVRDYIHVTDLVELHVAALDDLGRGGETGIMNCGYGHGYSVREVLDAVREVSGVAFPVHEAPRRPGDPPHLVADPSRVVRRLQFQPRFDDIRVIARTAFEWERRLCEGLAHSPRR